VEGEGIVESATWSRQRPVRLGRRNSREHRERWIRFRRLPLSDAEFRAIEGISPLYEVECGQRKHDREGVPHAPAAAPDGAGLWLLGAGSFTSSRRVNNKAIADFDRVWTISIGSVSMNRTFKEAAVAAC
jgi:hypothetical protein